MFITPKIPSSLPVDRCMRRQLQGVEDDVMVGDEGPEDRYEEEEMSYQMCDEVTRPDDMKHCQVPCPGECVVTQWSAWSRCPQVCTGVNQHFK